jgi:hypothetical protein
MHIQKSVQFVPNEDQYYNYDYDILINRLTSQPPGGLYVNNRLN